jgi:hypothetical protein
MVQINSFFRLLDGSRGSPTTSNDLAKKASVLAGEGNRTLVSSLEGYSFTIKLHPRARNVTRLPDTASAFSLRSLLEKVGSGH